MKKYEVLKNDFRPELEGQIIEVIQISGEYAQVITPLNTVWMLLSSLKEVIEAPAEQPNKIKTNKTNVLNSIEPTNKQDRENKDVLEVLRIKRGLKQRSVKDDLDSIEYYYNCLVDLYIGACKGWKHFSVQYMLKNAIKEILKSTIEINSYNKEYLNYLIQYDLL